jgi:hypothetical protein
MEYKSLILMFYANFVLKLISLWTFIYSRFSCKMLCFNIRICEKRIPKEHMLFVFFTLILFIASFSFFNVYAQQGGAAISGSNLAEPANCYGHCYFYGGSATGEVDRDGNAKGSDNGSDT